MHLRNHLEAFILDHGPVTAFRVLALNDLINSMGSERTNKRPVELQILKEFSSTRFQKDMKISLRKEFQGDFLEFCSNEENISTDDKDVSSSDCRKVYDFFNITTNARLRGINRLNKSAINVSSCYGLLVLTPMIWN